MRTCLRHLIRDDCGVIAPATAILMAVLLGMVGLVTDSSIWFIKRRDLQAATDAAALGAVRRAGEGGDVSARVVSLLEANGLTSASLVSVETGYYCPNPDGSAELFQSTRCANYTSAAPLTALRVKTKTTGPLILSRFFTSDDAQDPAITATATAALVNDAGLRAGTGLLNANVAQKYLSALAGGTVNLVSYQGLANADVNVLSLLDRLAIRENLTAGTYESVLQETVSVGTVLDAAADVLADSPQIAGANVISDLGSLKAAIQGSPQIRLGDIIDLGVWKDLPIGQGSGTSKAALSAGLNAYQLTTASLSLANGATFVDLSGVEVNLGLAKVNLEASAIERPQEPPFGFGPEGTTVHTAQVRTKLRLTLLNIPGVVSADLPLYAVAASGLAETTDISCREAPYSGAVPTSEIHPEARVIVRATPEIAHIWIGDGADVRAGIAPSQMAEINVASLVKVKLLADVPIGDSTAVPLTFVQPDTDQTAIPSTLSTQGIIGRPPSAGDPGSLAIPARTASNLNLFGSLGSAANVQAQICTGIVSLCLPASLSQVLLLLSPLLNPVDSLVTPVLNGLLNALGVQLGYMDVFVTGTRCGIPVLVE